MKWITGIAGTAWGLYAWLCFTVVCVFSLLVALIVPGQARRQRLVTLAARATFVLARVRVQVNGAQYLPKGSCVVVANHGSYIDGVLLNGYLPARFGFVIKGELRDIPIVHFLLRRSGSRFVERHETAGSVKDARQLVRAAQDGESLAFFPEGTFRKERGVGRFRLGAFVAAIKGDLPVVPIAISGTREMMPAKRLWPRRTVLGIEILPAITPGEDDFSQSRKLAESARQRILAVLNEPDLVEAN